MARKKKDAEGVDNAVPDTKTSTTDGAEPMVTILKTATAAKLSPRGGGELTYQIGRMDNTILLRIYKNDSSGRFSNEWVGVESLRRSLAQLPKKAMSNTLHIDHVEVRYRIYYNKPLYHLYLSSPLMRTCLFRLFGYRGQMDFTIYPDAWIRDLPLLDFGKGAYIANRCTLGSNLAHSDGTILVGTISVGEQATVGHLAIVGLGTVVGDGAEVSIATAVGLHNTLGAGVKVAPASAIGHSITIGSNTRLGQFSYVGNGAVIGDGLRVPDGALIPAAARVAAQQDILRYVSSRTSVPIGGNGEND